MGATSSSTSGASKPILRCVPSQKGVLAEPPQRQK
jgi:hypothetical protein